MEITPEKQNIDLLFSINTYHIDFYQRQYKWDDVPVKRLLEDVFYKFDQEYKKHKDSDIPLDQLVEKYSWYYLNTYVTNLVKGKLFVVDGQQRLTTITLVLIKLKHQAKKFNSGLEDWLKNKIFGQQGFNKEFWMNHEGHNAALQDLLDGKDLKSIKTDSGITAKNMVANYAVIEKWLDEELEDKRKFESFVFYFLKRLVLINLDVHQTEVPMVFEVINDRGVKLKPHEILKGKLLGQVDKEELDALNLNESWETQVSKVNKFKEDEIDQFFVYFLKAKLSDTRGTAVKFDKDYHRRIFDDECNAYLDLKHNSKKVKAFLQNEFKYYTNLYAKVLGFYHDFSDSQPYVYYNSLTEMDTQFLLILSVCKPNDTEEDLKISLVSRHIDRMFCLLQLQRSYDSNNFATELYKLSAEIRDKNADQIESIFNKYLLSLLADARGVAVQNLISYGFFKETGIELDKRFKRYFFARVDKFIAENTGMKMKHDLYNLVQNTGTVNGFHIEHILSENAGNKALFQDDKGENDEELFERERNRLGGLLLLKGKDNISSNNEPYSEKLKSYANTLYWNETLRADAYKSKLDFTGMMQKHNLHFKHMDSFGPKELEERHRLLFDIVKIIWE